MEWNQDSELFIVVVKEVAKKLKVPISIKNRDFQAIYTIAVNSVSDRDFLTKIKLLNSIKSNKEEVEEQETQKWEVEIESEENPVLSTIFKDSLKNNR